MEQPDRIREIALDEMHAAFIRFLARAGEGVGVHEVFAWAAAGWVHEWTASYLLPETPADADLERQLDDEVAHVREQLELREPREERDGA